ncbi:MAG: flagellar hook-associated protein FlgK [Planctomycetaceae bacterium]|nr:flagellar hook-associated protein FlgK [Planctomycetaceae bacterium]
MAGRSLEVFTTGIQVAGQNISNAATPGYIRQELKLEPSGNFRSGGLILGTGVVVNGIRQQLDKFLETRIHSANADSSASAARNTIYKQLEGELNELGDADLSTGLNSFLGAVQEAANHPESTSARQGLITQGQQLVDTISSLRTRVDQLRSDQSVKVDTLVGEANALIEQIARLNPQITKLESSGLLKSDAGELRVQRYSALTRLSEIIPTKFVEREDGSVDVFSGNEYVILKNHTQQLTTQATVDRGVQVQSISFTESTAAVPLTGGELAGVVQGRDNILGGFIDDLDTLTSNLIREFNQIHASGQGLIGFTSVTGTNPVYNTTTALSNAGLAFPPQHGSFQIKLANSTTGATVTTTVPIDLDGIDAANDTTLTSLRDYINTNVSGVTASITTDGFLRLNAASGYEIKFGNDTSGVLTSLGINTFFQGTDSNTIQMNPVVLQDARYLATGQGGGPSDGANALAMSNFLKSPVAELQGQSLDGFYDSIVSAIAQGSSAESAAATAYRDLRDSLLNQRDQTSGVSIDEETLKMLQFQRSFQAAARIVSTVDELYQVLLSM